MAGYSGKTLVQKIGLKPGHQLALAGEPDGFLKELAPLPDDVVVVTGGNKPLDCVILFAHEARTLESRIVRWKARLAPAGMMWIAWPKKASKVPTDITEDVLRSILLPVMLVDVKVCAVDEVWSGLKFMWRKEHRANVI